MGRISHHLVTVACPNIIKQLFYYTKALVSVNPFPQAKESVTLFLKLFLDCDEIAIQRYSLAESTFVRAAALHFTRGTLVKYNQVVKQFILALNSYIVTVTTEFRVSGPEIASTLCADLFDYGNSDSFLWKRTLAYNKKLKEALENHKTKTGQTTATAEEEANWKEEWRQAYFRMANNHPRSMLAAHTMRDSAANTTFSGAHDTVAQVAHLFHSSNEVIF